AGSRAWRKRSGASTMTFTSSWAVSSAAVRWRIVAASQTRPSVGPQALAARATAAASARSATITRSPASPAARPRRSTVPTPPRLRGRRRAEIDRAALRPPGDESAHDVAPDEACAADEREPHGLEYSRPERDGALAGC